MDLLPVGRQTGRQKKKMQEGANIEARFNRHKP